MQSRYLWGIVYSKGLLERFTDFEVLIYGYGVAVLIRRLEVSKISVSIYLLPFLGVSGGGRDVGEPIMLRMAAGGAVTLLGTVLTEYAGAHKNVG